MISSDELFALQTTLETYVTSLPNDDGAHDISHLRRVAKSAIKIGVTEKANLRVVLTSAYLHDIVNLPKNHPQRHQASSLSAAKAIEVLKERFPSVPAHEHAAIAHAIEAHSFSAGITPSTIEAKVLQDADRLEALGAVGIARVFYIAGRLGQSIFDGADPIASSRKLDDRKFAVDHFQVKLLKLHKTMQTKAGKCTAISNSRYMIEFLAKLASECSGDMTGIDEDTLKMLTIGENE